MSNVDAEPDYTSSNLSCGPQTQASAALKTHSSTVYCICLLCCWIRIIIYWFIRWYLKIIIHLLFRNLLMLSHVFEHLLAIGHHKWTAVIYFFRSAPPFSLKSMSGCGNREFHGRCSSMWKYNNDINCINEFTANGKFTFLPRFALADYGRPFVHGATECIRRFGFVCVELWTEASERRMLNVELITFVAQILGVRNFRQIVN